MSDELAYAIITPYSIRKSRTGGIVSRLLSRSGLELVAGRMFAPSRELIEEYAKSIVTETDDRHRRTQELIREYVLENLAPNAEGKLRRVLLLVLRGEDAVNKVLDVAGHIVHARTAGETIRDTYGDYFAEDGRVEYFEPAVLCAPNRETARTDLRLWARFSAADGGILDAIVPHPAGAEVQKTLVLIKPDNFRFPNARPGGVLDLFSRTGLSIIGFKVHHMSVAQAEQFYGPVLEVLERVMRESTGRRVRLAAEEELGCPLGDDAEAKLGDLLGPIAGRAHWESIVQFMAGTRPSQCPPERRELPGSEKCVAVVYQGVDAVAKIRQVLGPTDPSKAPSGTIRREFGQTMMINAAHASDSPENAAREFAIIRIDEDIFAPLVATHFDSGKSAGTSPRATAEFAAHRG
jgi:nucleoside diphosphate kinase